MVFASWYAMAKATATWFPTQERGLLQGIIITAGRLGAGVASGLTIVVTNWGRLTAFADEAWRVPFILFGVLGVVWAVGFAAWFRDTPAEHPSVNEAELDWIRGKASVSADGIPTSPGRGAAAVRHIPWRTILTSTNLLALSGAAYAQAGQTSPQATPGSTDQINAGSAAGTETGTTTAPSGTTTVRKTHHIVHHLDAIRFGIVRLATAAAAANIQSDDSVVRLQLVDHGRPLRLDAGRETVNQHDRLSPFLPGKEVMNRHAPRVERGLLRDQGEFLCVACRRHAQNDTDQDEN